MFDTLSTRLGQVFDRLRGRGALSEADVNEALREVRVALLEADVALPVVKDFIEKVRVKAVGQDVLRSVTPGQQVVKIVHDELTAVLGEEAKGLDLEAAPPVVIMMVGLQGSGKTTTTAKIARRLTQRDRKKVLMASLDVQRPAAQEQLRVLGEQAGVPTLPVLFARRSTDPADTRLLDLLDSDLSDDAALAECLELIRRHPAMDEARAYVVAEAEKAKDLLAVLPAGPVREALEKFADVVAVRSA